MLMEIIGPPCKAYPLGLPVNVTFTLTNTGARQVPLATVVFNMDPSASYVGVQVVDPTGQLSECTWKNFVVPN